MLKDYRNYVDDQLNKSKMINESNAIDKGSRVVVDGVSSGIKYDNRKGTVITAYPHQYLIEFDDDDSRNLMGYTALIHNVNIVKLSENQNDKIFKSKQSVICTDKSSNFYNKVGKINFRFDDDNSYMVTFHDDYGEITVYLKNHQLKEYDQPISSYFFGPLSPSSTSDPINKVTNVEEEEEDDFKTKTSKKQITKQDLLEFSCKDLFYEEKFTTKDDLIKTKEKYIQELKNPELSNIKKIYYEKAIGSIEIVEQYFDFLRNKVSNDLPIYRTTEQIDDKDLLINKTKVKASESKELTKKYSFDQGIIVYWKFIDGVVFKTI